MNYSYNYYYNWITDKIAIGELNSSYEPFDIIVNLAYINPSYNKGLEHRQYRIVLDDKLKYEFGLYDSDMDSQYFYDILEYLIPKLVEAGDKKILFHCQSGKSRSVSVATAYLCKKLGISIEDCLSLIKNKRYIINPRNSFIDCVNKYISTNFNTNLKNSI